MAKDKREGRREKGEGRREKGGGRDNKGGECLLLILLFYIKALIPLK